MLFFSSEVFKLYPVNQSAKPSWCKPLSSSYCRKFSPRLLCWKDIHTPRNCCYSSRLRSSAFQARTEFDILRPSTSSVCWSLRCYKGISITEGSYSTDLLGKVSLEVSTRLFCLTPVETDGELVDTELGVVEPVLRTVPRR